MSAKICLITGANSGIGYATAEGLASQGYHIIMVCRDQQRGTAAKQAILQQIQGAKVDLLVADLSSAKDIVRLAQQVKERHNKLDVLINNAGGVFSSYQTNDDGFEQTFAVNYLAPFLLTRLLLPQLQASGAGRIINVASIMQAKQFEADEAAHPLESSYRGMKAYKLAKTAVLMMTYRMAKEWSGSGVTVNALHPGVIYTPQSARSVPAFARPLLKLFMQSPQQGSRTSIYLATSEEVAATTGQFFKAMQTAPTVPVTMDVDKQNELHDQSMVWMAPYLEA
ncbi:SDR family NAD(P)-dependent oxidoreductase [Paenibacillus daejeonensis]|uniref:SDR family NAD(P)-dependent oxidoreductase n=1 Tax=Paenibacillus daejeonensis TaxID=135193 RepID=UPI000A04BAC9|nr:SDR family NAD(P)-dependent oxidoreductase [Paenibacillus daejeonensis]